MQPTTMICTALVVSAMVLPMYRCQLDSLTDLLNNILNPTVKQSKTCPEDCVCTHMSLFTLLNKYVDENVNHMGSNMREQLNSKTKKLLTGNFIAALVVNNTYFTHIKCLKNDTFSLTDIYKSSPTTRVALQIECADGSNLIWDVTGKPPPTYSVTVLNCRINATQNIVVSNMAWIVHFENINAEIAERIDFSLASSLIALTLANSSLQSIPSSWAEYSIDKLSYINLQGNLLQQYNCSIGVNMDTINLNHNKLYRIPYCITNYKRYQPSYLSLENNSISDITELFFVNHTMKIMYLSLKNNLIEELEPFHNTSLRSLDLSENAIKGLPENVFVNVVFLIWIDLSRNELYDLGSAPFQYHYLLKYINLSYNNLREITFDQGPVSVHVVQMDLRSNLLRYPPFHDTGYISPRLTKIQIAGNPFICDCGMEEFFSFLKELNRTAYLNYVALKNEVVDSYDVDADLVQPYVDVLKTQCFWPKNLRSIPLLSVNMTLRCPIVDECPKHCLCFRNKLSKELNLECSNSEEHRLPDTIPPVSDYTNFSVILFNNSDLYSVDYRHYLNDVSELYLNNNSINKITAAAIMALKYVRVLHLHDNDLSEFPKEMSSVDFVNLQSLTLHENPWMCVCKTRWFSEWIHTHNGFIENPETVKCTTQFGVTKPVIEIQLRDYDCDELDYMKLVISFSVFIVIVVFLSVFIYKFRLEIRVWLYTNFRWRPFDNFKYDNDDLEFDAFVSFSQADYKWIVHTLVRKLENEPYNRKLCVHHRDFPVGSPVLENIVWATHRSRCTLLYLTPDFLQSEWCMYEFREAHKALLQSKDNRLIILVKGDVKKRIEDNDLNAYMRTRSFLNVDDRWLWSKLEYALPSR